MPVRRRPDHQRADRVPKAVRCAMTDQPLPDGTTPWLRWYLGKALLGMDAGGRPSEVPMPLRDYWREHSAGILADWAEDHAGTRPRCWWTFTAPRDPAGCPAGSSVLPAAPLHRGETEGAYLIRHGLLLPGEMARLEAGA
jgi:hypothetical protein